MDEGKTVTIERNRTLSVIPADSRARAVYAEMETDGVFTKPLVAWALVVPMQREVTHLDGYRMRIERDWEGDDRWPELVGLVADEFVDEAPACENFLGYAMDDEGVASYETEAHGYRTALNRRRGVKP
jgi:hypothetical protein